MGAGAHAEREHRHGHCLLAGVDRLELPPLEALPLAHPNSVFGGAFFIVCDGGPPSAPARHTANLGRGAGKLLNYRLVPLRSLAQFTKNLFGQPQRRARSHHNRLHNRRIHLIQLQHSIFGSKHFVVDNHKEIGFIFGRRSQLMCIFIWHCDPRSAQLWRSVITAYSAELSGVSHMHFVNHDIYRLSYIENGQMLDSGLFH